jgi:hypothetical protein
VAVGGGTACVAELGRVGALVPAVGAVVGGLALVGVVVGAADCTRPFGPAVNGGVVDSVCWHHRLEHVELALWFVLYCWVMPKLLVHY